MPYHFTFRIISESFFPKLTRRLLGVAHDPTPREDKVATGDGQVQMSQSTGSKPPSPLSRPLSEVEVEMNNPSRFSPLGKVSEAVPLR